MATAPKTTKSPARKPRATPRKAPATKATTAKSVASVKPVPKATEQAASAVVQQDIAIVQQAEMRKKELIDQAVERSGLKKSAVKPAIEAALAVLGDALAEGRGLNLQPLGKIRVMRMKRTGNGVVINARIRQPETTKDKPQNDAENTAKAPLAPSKD